MPPIRRFEKARALLDETIYGMIRDRRKSGEDCGDLLSMLLAASDSEARQEIAAKIQERAFETIPYIPTGQYSPKTAYRKNLRGIIIAPALFMWNVEKT